MRGFLKKIKFVIGIWQIKWVFFTSYSTEPKWEIKQQVPHLPTYLNAHFYYKFTIRGDKKADSSSSYPLTFSPVIELNQNMREKTSGSSTSVSFINSFTILGVLIHNEEYMSVCHMSFVLDLIFMGHWQGWGNGNV